MFSFLNPWFLVAAGAAVIPLVLHLIQSSRAVRMPFSTLRFLKLAQARASRRLRMQHWLLWMLRTLLLVLLPLSFAMPILRTGTRGGILGRARRDVAIVLDVSYSMLYTAGGRAAWQQAVETARAIIEGLLDRDRFCIYLAADEPIPLIEQLSGDRAGALAQLRDLQVSYTSSRLAPAVRLAADALDAEKRPYERELHIVADNQAVAWRDFIVTNAAVATTDIVWDPERVNERTTCFVTLLGVPEPANTAPVDADVSPLLLLAGSAAAVSARLTHTGPPVEATVTLVVDGNEVGRRSTALGAGPAAPLTFKVPPLTQGEHPAYLETPADNLVEDNRFYFLLRARDALPALCVGAPEDTLFVKAALRAGERDKGGIEPRFITRDALANENLSSYACIFLCNALPLAGQDIVRMESYIRDGGLLTIFPGDNSAVDDYAAWQCLPAIPDTLLEIPLSERRRSLRWDPSRHALLSNLPLVGSAPAVTMRRRLDWTTTPADAEVLVTAGAEHPFLLARNHGNGCVLLFAVSPDRSWSDFPLSPYFLPFLHQVVRYSAGVGNMQPYVWTRSASTPLSQVLPQAGPDTVLYDPASRRVPIRSAVVDGRTVLHAESLDRPGIYSASTRGGHSAAPALAVNMPRGESDLTPIDAGDVPGLLGLPHVTVAENATALTQLLDTHRMGQTLGEPLLWLVLIIAVIEFCYACTLMRPPSKLTDELRIDPSGRVSRARKPGRAGLATQETGGTHPSAGGMS